MIILSFPEQTPFGSLAVQGLHKDAVSECVPPCIKDSFIMLNKASANYLHFPFFRRKNLQQNRWRTDTQLGKSSALDEENAGPYNGSDHRLGPVFLRRMRRLGCLARGTSSSISAGLSAQRCHRTTLSSPPADIPHRAVNFYS